MNALVLLLLVVAAGASFRRSGGPPVPGARWVGTFAAVLALHLAVIATLLAFFHKHP
jgi:hypothetical protein